MENFINTLRNLMFPTSKQSTEDTVTSKRQKQVTARSGQNIQFPHGDTGLSEGYKDALVDAVKFYQDEFGITPHADIAYDPEWLRGQGGDEVAGITTLQKPSTGQSDVVLGHLTDKDQNVMNEIAKESESTGWSPRNAKDIAHIPVHEFGHAVYDMLFPYNLADNSHSRDIYKEALRDLGIGSTGDFTSEDAKKSLEEVRKISGYASTEDGETGLPNADEVVAESISDYYYNRGDAAPLSKAIVRRLKNESHMYKMKQAGGITPVVSGYTFLRNLRRYGVIQ